MTSIVGRDGLFRFGSLQRGRWRLTLWVSGRLVASATVVEIRGDESSPVQVVLTNSLTGER